MPTEPVQGAISALLEDRRYPPDAAFVAQANVNDPAIYERPPDPEAFWAEQAKGLDWIEPYEKVSWSEWNVPPWAKWFVGGKLNASVNCVDRHAKSWRKNKAAHHLGGRARAIRAR